MAFTVNTLSLSTLNPVKLVYKFNNAEQLESQLHTNDNNLNYVTHELLNNTKDVVFSKHTMLALTEIKDLKTIFLNKQEELDINVVSGSFHLSVPKDNLNDDETNVTLLNNNFFLGGKGSLAIFNIIPIEPGIVELKVDNQFVQFTEEYPHTLITSPETLQDNDIVRQRFFLTYNGEYLTIQAATKSGLRYLSSGADRILRFVGINLNQTKINDYLLKPTFISSSSVSYNFDPSTTEIKYYNDTTETNNQKTVNIKTQTQINTNLLISCPCAEFLQNNEAVINVSLLKTNFSALGTFNSSL